MTIHFHCLQHTLAYLGYTLEVCEMTGGNTRHATSSRVVHAWLHILKRRQCSCR